MNSKLVKNLVNHAKRYGTDSVMEAGIDVGLTFPELVDLQEKVDQLDDENWRASHTFGKPPRRKLTSEVRVRRLLQLPDEEETG